MYYGADYYPEHWPEERWPRDARMMREAGLNIVRLAEFSWAKLETQEGRFDFSWLDRAMKILEPEGIKVILGTPTATPPKWIMDADPGIYPVNSEGTRMGFGIRRHYCPNNPNYRRHTSRIVEALASHYAGQPQVVAWQIDNEFGDQCYCDTCLAKFHIWLERKYDDIDSLNREWGTMFWSQLYGSFDQVPSPRGYKGLDSHLQHNPSLALDYFRFCSDSYKDYQGLQAGIIRSHSAAPITHNLMVGFGELDYFDMASDLDFVSLDNYPLTAWRKSRFSRSSMSLDHMRCLKGRGFWMMEQQSGPCGWNTIGESPQSGQLRLWAFQTVAHGAEAILYFRWRASQSGREQYWYGILDHDGKARRRYQEIKATGEELRGLGPLVTQSRIDSEVAIILSYDNLWSHRISPHNPRFEYYGLLQAYYDAIVANYLNVDLCGVGADWSRYRVVFMPAFDLMTPALRKKCQDFVDSGGTLVLSFRSGTRTWNNRMSELSLPGEFGDLAGIELEEFDSIGSGGRCVAVDGDFGPGQASIWCDVIECHGARPIASYQDAYYAGKAAASLYEYGKGRVYYLGCDLDPQAMVSFVNSVCSDVCKAPIVTNRHQALELVRRQYEGQDYWICLNHDAQVTRLEFDAKYCDRLSGHTGTTLTLGAYGVAVISLAGSP